MLKLKKKKKIWKIFFGNIFFLTWVFFFFWNFRIWPKISRAASENLHFFRQSFYVLPYYTVGRGGLCQLSTRKSFFMLNLKKKKKNLKNIFRKYFFFDLSFFFFFEISGFCQKSLMLPEIKIFTLFSSIFLCFAVLQCSQRNPKYQGMSLRMILWQFEVPNEIFEQ